MKRGELNGTYGCEACLEGGEAEVEDQYCSRWMERATRGSL